ncbi:MAG: hypothetical protein AB7K04_17130 [Pseudorhodoplanes sp.]
MRLRCLPDRKGRQPRNGPGSIVQLVLATEISRDRTNGPLAPMLFPATAEEKPVISRYPKWVDLSNRRVKK